MKKSEKTVPRSFEACHHPSSRLGMALVGFVSPGLVSMLRPFSFLVCWADVGQFLLPRTPEIESRVKFSTYWSSGELRGMISKLRYELFWKKIGNSSTEENTDQGHVKTPGVVWFCCLFFYVCFLLCLEFVDFVALSSSYRRIVVPLLLPLPMARRAKHGPPIRPFALEYPP